MFSLQKIQVLKERSLSDIAGRHTRDAMRFYLKKDQRASMNSVV